MKIIFANVDPYHKYFISKKHVVVFCIGPFLKEKYFNFLKIGAS